jgi:hypothetical protein
MKEQFGITFEKIISENGTLSHFATAQNIQEGEVARHLICSNKRAVEMQISDLQQALREEKVQEHWGEIMGSNLFIYQSKGTVQVNYYHRQIAIQDFKQLLEEWLVFLNE